MIQTISLYDFREAFRNCRPNNFTYNGLAALFEYMEAYEDDAGEQVELDVIGICCEFSEYADFAGFVDDYGEDYGKTWEELMDHTMVILIPHAAGAIVRLF